MTRNRRYRTEYEQQLDSKKFDFGLIFKFVSLNVVYCFLIYLVRNILLQAILDSPRHKLGNDIISLYEVHNRGAAFNLFENQPDLIIAASFFAVLVISFIVFTASTKLSHSLVSAMACLTSGIIMNVVDRTMYGFVIDYIQIGIIPGLPVFNLADVLIVAGAIGIIGCVINKK
ncbi:signal peptidase II [bacterium]|nr:signal peptidase II [bacterium]